VSRKKVVDLARARKAQATLERRLDALAGQGVRPIPVEELEGLIMAKTKEREGETQPVAFRLETELLKRLDEHAKRMAAETPGLKLTRTDVVRVLLLKGLDAEDKRGRR
jgi:hypothetical protein